MVTKFVGKAPIDVLWVSDSWLPEWADAGWIAPVERLSGADEVQRRRDEFCVESMQYKGKQYGLTYYSDYMALLLRRGDAEEGRHQGAAARPGTRSSQQSAKIKQGQGLSQYPLMLVDGAARAG